MGPASPDQLERAYWWVGMSPNLRPVRLAPRSMPDFRPLAALWIRSYGLITGAMIHAFVAGEPTSLMAVSYCHGARGCANRTGRKFGKELCASLHTPAHARTFPTHARTSPNMPVHARTCLHGRGIAVSEAQARGRSITRSVMSTEVIPDHIFRPFLRPDSG
jgi:hypothetical protein